MDDPRICCLHCDGIARTRGICWRHYNALAERVRSGLTTWADAEAEGLCLRAVKRRLAHKRKDSDRSAIRRRHHIRRILELRRKQNGQ